METNTASSQGKDDGKSRRVPPALKILRWNFRNVGRVAPGLMSSLGLYFWFRPQAPRRPRPEDQAILDAARELAIESGGERLAVYVWGEDEQPAIFLMHGWSGRAAQMTAFVEPLREAGYRVVALDAPGHGKNPRRRVKVSDITSAISKTSEEHGPFEGVLAHSLSTLWCSVSMGRGGLQAKRAVSVCGVASMDPMIEHFSRLLDLPKPVGASLADKVNGAIPEDFWDHSTMTVPVLFIHDKDDDFIPYEVGERLSREWPDARLHTTSGLGHRRILRDPGVIAKAIEFFRGSASAESAEA
jgi:pimeloyl-ACP methyl ester carboxylesterase